MSKEQLKVEQPKKEEVEKEPFKHVETVLDRALAEEEKYAYNQGKLYTIPIEAFTKVYPDDLNKLKRLDELAEIYKSEFEKHKKANPEGGSSFWKRKTTDFIFGSVLTEQEKQGFKDSQKNEKSRQEAGYKDSKGLRMIGAIGAEISLAALLHRINKAKPKEVEKPEATTEKKEKKRPQHEVELKERPYPQEGEALDMWLKRIGGPNIDMIGNLKVDPTHELSDKEKENEPLIISKNGDLLLNDKNIVKIFGEEDKKKADGAGLFNKKTERYRIKKELFKEPEGYYKIIAGVLKNNNHILADKAFRKSVEKWVGELEEGREVAEVAEEPEKEEEMEAKEKPITLDEKIRQKERELEEAKRNYNIYYSPVVQDLQGLYYKKEFEKAKKELKELERGAGKKKEKAKTKEEPKKEPREIKEEPKEVPEPKEMPEEVPEEPTTEEQFKEIKKQLRKVYRGIREGGVLGRADLEKQQYRLEKIKKKIEERLNAEKRLKEISKKIEQGGVLGRSKLEKEQKRLERKLKKLA